MPQIRGAIEDHWFVPEDDTSGNRYQSKSAGVQMYSASPDRMGDRAALDMNVVSEDSNVVGSVAGAELGASSERTQNMRAAQSREASLPPGVEMQGGTPIMKIGATKKAEDGPTEVSRSTSAASVENAAARRAQERAAARREAERQRRAAKAQARTTKEGIRFSETQRRGQRVGVNGLEPAEAPVGQGQRVGVNGLESWDQPAPGPEIRKAEGYDAEYEEYQEFLRWKRMKAQAEAQAHTHDHDPAAEAKARAAARRQQAVEAQKRVEASGDVITLDNWPSQTEGLHWRKKGQLAVEEFGHDPSALEVIREMEGKGVSREIDRLLSE